MLIKDRSEITNCQCLFLMTSHQFTLIKSPAIGTQPEPSVLLLLAADHWKMVNFPSKQDAGQAEAQGFHQQFKGHSVEDPLLLVNVSVCVVISTWDVKQCTSCWSNTKTQLFVFPSPVSRTSQILTHSGNAHVIIPAFLERQYNHQIIILLHFLIKLILIGTMVDFWFCVHDFIFFTYSQPISFC